MMKISQMNEMMWKRMVKRKSSDRLNKISAFKYMHRILYKCQYLFLYPSEVTLKISSSFLFMLITEYITQNLLFIMQGLDCMMQQFSKILMNNYQDLCHAIKCGLCSFTSTYIAGVMHPLDLIKTRYQSHDGRANTMNLVPKYSGVIQGLRDIHYTQGFKGLYKGFYVSLLSQGLATGFFFWIYEARKTVYEREGLEVMDAVTMASVQASILATLITQPFWVVKTRMLLNIKPNQKEWPHAIQKIREIYSQHGSKGFLKGLSLSLVLSFSGVLQMYIYEGSKLAYQYLDIPSSRYSQENFICGSLSKFISVLFTYPITTIRTRIQQNQFVAVGNRAKYASIQDVVSKLITGEGILGFYKGITANMMKGIPQRGIYFYFYEKMKAIFTNQPLTH